MQIACPTCATSYEISAASLGDSGRLVRCVHCKETWFAQLPELAEAAPAAPAAPSMWQEEQQTSGWATREGALPGTASAKPEDRFAADSGEVEFALPPELQEIAEAPPTAPEEQGPEGEAAPELEAEHAVEAEIEPDAQQADADAPLEEPEELDYHEVRRRRSGDGRRSVKPRRNYITKSRLIAAMAAVVVGLVFLREHVARMMPQTASLYAHLGLPVNLRGLSLESIKAGVEQQDGVAVLVIEGAIRNITREPVEVPRLRFAMRNAGGTEIYSWTSLPERAVLPPGEVQPFRTRLASPPGDSKSVYVRFFQRRDIVAATQHRNEDGTHSPRGR